MSKIVSPQKTILKKYQFKRAKRHLKSPSFSYNNFLIFGALAIIILFWFLFFSGFFRIKKITLKRENLSSGLVKEEEIKTIIKKFTEEKKWLIFSQKNFFIFDLKKAKKYLEEDRRLSEVKINKIWPNQLLLEIKEVRPQSILTMQDGKILFLVEGGRLIEAKEGMDLSLPVTLNQTEKNLDNDEFIEAIKSVSRLLTSAFLEPYKIKIEQIFLDDSEGVITIKIFTSEGWQIYFLPKNIEQQINNLEIVLKEKIKERKGLSYIDMRFGDRVFYK